VLVLCIGDVVGKPGRDIVVRALPGLVRERGIDLVICNAENAAGGSGLTPSLYRDLVQAGCDAITLGDHVYRRREIVPTLESESNIVRPANLPAEAAGRRWAVVTAKNGVRAFVCCVLGQLYMKPADSPWRAVDAALAEAPPNVRVKVVEFHAEATSEKQSMGRYLDGRVSAVVGTHTHVATADECVFAGGTAFQCDLGMTGPHDSILGRRSDRVLQATLTGMPLPFDVATGDSRINGALIDVDPETGHARSIERVCVTDADAERLANASR
jgi:hypothetical protein